MPFQLLFGGVEVTCEFLNGIHRNENKPFKNTRKEQLNSSIVSSVKLLVSSASFLFWSIMSRESEKMTPLELPLPQKKGFCNVKGSVLAIKIPHHVFLEDSNQLALHTNLCRPLFLPCNPS